jgi:hypothetical protein
MLLGSGFRYYSKDLPRIITHLASYGNVPLGYYSNRYRMIMYVAVLGIVTLISETVKNRRRAIAS